MSDTVFDNSCGTWFSLLGHNGLTDIGELGEVSETETDGYIRRWEKVGVFW